MLVLSRRCDESIVIGADVRVRVLKVQGDIVKLGVEAPRSTGIYRGELFEQIRAANIQSVPPEVPPLPSRLS